MNTFRGDSAVTAELSGISTGGVAEGGHLTGDQVKASADAHSVVQESWSQLVGLMLSAPPVELARGLLDGLPPVAPDPMLQWWLTGARSCVLAEVVPTPLTVADAAIRAGLDAPPGMRGLILTHGWGLVSEVTAIPMACGWHLARIIRAGTIRRSAETAGERIRAAAWHGDLDSLAELVQREAGTLLSSLAAELVAGDV